MDAERAIGDAARLGHRDKKAGDRPDRNAWQVRPSVPSPGAAEGNLRNLQIVPVTPIGQCAGMTDPLLLLIAAAFLLAGFIKGACFGLALPTVSMGLLAVTMPPAQALAIVIVPAIVTNIWQTFLSAPICATSSQGSGR